MTLRVGFIGLGAMGAPMAAMIARSRRADPGGAPPLVVHARREESAREVRAGGAVWAATPAELAAQVDIVITMLPDLPELREVIYGDFGLLAGAAGWRVRRMGV